MVGHVLSRGVVNKVIRTLFADERVVPVVGIVSVAKSSMRIFKFEELVAMLARMTRASSFFFFSLKVGEQERYACEVR